MSRKQPKSNKTENAMVRALDTLAAYEEYTTEVLPLLRKAIAEGWDAETIENHPTVKAALVARQLSIAFTGKPGEALAAIKDSRDRKDGKAVERKDVKLSLENAPDAEIEARLKTLLGERDDETSSDDNISH